VVADRLKSKVATIRADPPPKNYDEKPLPVRRRTEPPEPRVILSEVDRPIRPDKGHGYDIDDKEDEYPPRNTKGGGGRRRGKRPPEPAADLLEFNDAPETGNHEEDAN
jgi:hypothetical protein